MKAGQVAGLSLCGALAIAGSAHAADIPNKTDQDALKTTLETCGACHGLHGLSISPMFPNLAAQKSQYIELELKAFKDHSRSDPDGQAYMWGMASQLSEAQMRGIAGYFAAQPAPPGTPGDPALIAQGKVLYEKGVPSRGIPPCASCHGAKAEGLEGFPRLAGQHASYLYRQLIAIQSVLRTAPVMHGVIKDLTTDQLHAVVTYVGSI